MTKQLICVIALTLAMFTANGQNSIGVNTDTPNPNAALDIRPVSGQVQGVLIPRLSTTERTGMALTNADNGMMVFDQNLGNLFIWNSGSWLPVAIEGTAIVNVDGTTITGDGGITPLSVNIGTGPSQIVQLDGFSALPAVDGSLLTGITATINPDDISTVEILDGTITGGDIASGTINDVNINDVDFSKIINLPPNLDIDASDDLTVAMVGTAAGQIVQLDASGFLPSLDAGALFNLPPTTVLPDGSTITGDGVGVPLAVNTGTGANQIVQLDGSGFLPSLDAGALFNLPPTTVLPDGSTITGDGVGVPLAVNVGTSANQIVQLDGSGFLPSLDAGALFNLPPTTVLPDGSTITGDGVGVPLAVNTGTGANQIVQLDGSGFLPSLDAGALFNLPPTTVLPDGSTITGDGVGVPLAVNVGTSANQIVQLDGSGFLPSLDAGALFNLPPTTVLPDGSTITGDGVGVPLAVNTGTGANQIVQLDGSGFLPALDGGALFNLPPSVSSGNGVTVSGLNVDLGGVLASTATITTSAGSNVLIDGAGIFDIDAVTDFSAQSTFSNIDVVGGTIFGVSLTQADNTFVLEDEGTGNSASFELSALTGPQIYTLPDASGPIALISDIAGAGLWADNAGDIHYNAGYVGIGTSTPTSNLHIYNNGIDQPSTLTIDAQGTQSGQLAGLVLNTLGDGAADVSTAGTNGWMMLGYGDTFSDTQRQNELTFSNFIGNTETSAILHLEPNGNVGIGTGDPLVSFHVNSTDAIQLPVGTTVQAPTGAGAANGMIRYNSDNLAFEGYSLGSWSDLGSGGGITGAVNGLNVNGLNVELGGALSVATEIYGNDFTIRRSSVDNSIPTLHLYNDSGNNLTGGSVVLESKNFGGSPVTIGKIESRMTNDAIGTESGELLLSAVSSGSLIAGLRIMDVGDVEVNQSLQVLGTTTTNLLDVTTRIRLNGTLESVPGVVGGGTITPNQRVIRISGSITTLFSGLDGQELILISDGGADLADGLFVQTSPLTGSLNMSNLSTLHLISLGGQWLEISRSIK